MCHTGTYQSRKPLHVTRRGWTRGWAVICLQASSTVTWVYCPCIVLYESFPVILDSDPFFLSLIPAYWWILIKSTSYRATHTLIFGVKMIVKWKINSGKWCENWVWSCTVQTFRKGFTYLYLLFRLSPVVCVCVSRCFITLVLSICMGLCVCSPEWRSELQTCSGCVSLWSCVQRMWWSLYTSL